MILIAGGHFDVNLRILSDRLKQREIPFHSLLVGPERIPNLRIDLQNNSFELDGNILSPTACFIRHDVFLHQGPNMALAHTAALNWYQAVRGWVVSQPDIRLFNRYVYLRENNKIQNLLLAKEYGLPIPDTLVVSHFSDLPPPTEAMIQKPVAGGEYTGLLSDVDQNAELPPYPRFIQPRLRRPEMRIYRVGLTLMAFWLHASELDYRRTQEVEITATPVPSAIGEKLMLLCDRLELDFAAADFMADEEGRLHFLEVNSQPMFAAFDRVAEGKLCDAIIDYLRR